MQSIDLIWTYAYRNDKNLVDEREEIKCSNVIKLCKMTNFDDAIEVETKDHNPDLPQIPDHPCRILITKDSGSGKTNSLFNLINHQPVIDKIYLNAKDPYETKYQFLIKKMWRCWYKEFW